MVYTLTALVVAAVMAVGNFWPSRAVGGEAQEVAGTPPLCQRIPDEWMPFTYKGMEFYRIPLPASVHPGASAVGTWRCSDIPKEWTPFTYKGQQVFRIPLQPSSQPAGR